MRRFLGATACCLLLVVYLAPLAQSEPVEDGRAVGAGWGLAADLGPPGTISLDLVPSAVADVPAPCPAAPDPCEDSDANDLLTAQVLGGGIADASTLLSEAYAIKDPDLSTNPERFADLETLMDTHSGVTLPDEWNLRGYGAVTDLSVDLGLLGSVTADLVEAEAVSGLRDVAGTPTPVSASGANIDDLRINGVVVPILPGMGPNTNIPTGIAGLTITYWQTNWDTTDGTTTDGNPVFVNTLRITSTIAGASFDIVVARAQAEDAVLAAPPANGPPDAVNDNVNTTEDTAIDVDVMFNDSDPDGDAITVTPGTYASAEGGQVVCDADSCTYTPPPNFVGTDSFNYEICDPDGECDTATVTVTIGAAPPGGNNPPTPVNDSVTTQQGVAVPVIDVMTNDTDPDGDAITITPDGGATTEGGTFSCTMASCSYTPPAGFTGTDTFTYEVCDNGGACASATVTITVSASNNPPNAGDDTTSTPQNTGIDINVLANDSDPDGDLITVTAGNSVSVQGGQVSCDANSCTYTPPAGFVGSDSFTYEICDPDGACDTATVTVTVTAPPAVNNDPDAQDDSASTDQDVAVDINVPINDTDPDGDVLTVTAGTAASAQGGQVVCDADSCLYTPPPGFVGTDTFTYEVCDPDGACDTATVTVAVIDPGAGNNPPVAADDGVTTDEGVAVAVINVMANDSDPDGDAIAITPVVGLSAQGGVVSCTVASCAYTPPGGFSGADSFDYEICDTNGACATATVNITVNPAPTPNNPPVARDDSATTNEDTPIAIDVVKTPPAPGHDSDPDGNLVPSTASVTIPPTNGQVACSGGVCTYTPDAGYVGNDSFTYRICDTDSACDTAVVSITIDAGPPPPPPVNQPPDAQDNTATSNGGSVTIPVINNDSDPEDELDPSSVTVTQQPVNGGAVICSAGSCTYTPSPGFTGTDSFEYQVCDDDNVCDSATVTITVTGPGPVAGPANQPPVAEDDTVTVPPGQPTQIVVVDNDSDPDGNLNPGTVTVVSPPAHGAVICSNGACTYTPEPDYTGEDNFDYRVCDAFGACTTATVTIEIPSGPGPSPSPSASPDGPDGSVGEGGNPGDGSGVPNRPPRDGQPSRPGGGGDDAGIDPVPLTGLNPILGAPNNPAMPMTGGEPGFYLALALNLVLAGGLLLFLDTRSRRAAPVALPELLGGGAEIDRTEPQPTPVAAETPLEPVSLEPATKKPAQKKPAAKKPTTARKPVAKKVATAKTSTAKKTVAKKAASTKKSTVAKPAAKKASCSKKTTVRGTSSKKSTVAKKSTVRKTTVRKSAAAS